MVAQSALDGPHIMTVRGPIDPEELDVTLMHEHIQVRLWEKEGRFDDAGLIEDQVIIGEELRQFKSSGGSGIVELSVRGLHPQPQRLRQLSETTGIHIIVGCGWFTDAYLPQEDLIDRRSVEELSGILVRDINDGLMGSGIKPGIIGEVGADNSWLSAREERVHRAVARAAIASGLSITTHAMLCDIGLHQLDIFEEEGVHLDRVIIGHADTFPSGQYRDEILSRGATIQFDKIGTMFTPLVESLAESVVELVDAGYGGQILLSHDVHDNSHLKRFGGNGYTYVSDYFVPLLERQGLGQEDIDKILVQNPRRHLSVAV